MKKIAIIGGGASGLFLAANLPNNKNIEIVVFEKSAQVLQKVLVSGGGRCNATHTYSRPKEFPKNYPRGQQFLKKWLKIFSPLDFEQWMLHRGVRLHTEADGRMFPTTNQSQTIANAILDQALKNHTIIHLQTEIVKISYENALFILEDKIGKTYTADIVVAATGGAPKPHYLKLFTDLGIMITPLVPSLFTFKLADKSITKLMGISLPNAQINIIQSDFQFSGPLLITHWGFSGPAVLKLSAFAAEYLAALDYNFQIRIKWLAEKGEKEWLDWFSKPSKQKLSNYYPPEIPKRLWLFLLQKATIDPEKTVNLLTKKEIFKFTDVLIRSVFEIRGKTTFKEEFVTAGGVELTEINPDTMEHIRIKNLYFTGEMLNIDGITGGFNFQSAWATAYTAALDISKKI